MIELSPEDSPGHCSELPLSRRFGKAGPGDLTSPLFWAKEQPMHPQHDLYFDRFQRFRLAAEMLAGLLGPALELFAVTNAIVVYG